MTFGDGFVVIRMSSSGSENRRSREEGVCASACLAFQGSYCLEETKGVVTSLMFQK